MNQQITESKNEPIPTPYRLNGLKNMIVAEKAAGISGVSHTVEGPMVIAKMVNEHMSMNRSRGTAEFIVTACNAHDDLVKALQAYVTEFEQNGRTDFSDSEEARYSTARDALIKAGAL